MFVVCLFHFYSIFVDCPKHWCQHNLPFNDQFWSIRWIEWNGNHQSVRLHNVLCCISRQESATQAEEGAEFAEMWGKKILKSMQLVCMYTLAPFALLLNTYSFSGAYRDFNRHWLYIYSNRGRIETTVKRSAHGKERKKVDFTVAQSIICIHVNKVIEMSAC